MAATEAELEQKFTEVLTSRPATAPCGAMGALDPPRADVHPHSPGPNNDGPARSHGPLADSYPYGPCAGLPHRTGGLERVDVGRPHQRLGQPLRGNSPTPGRALRLLWCGAGPRPYHHCQPRNRVTTARGTPWSITRHQDYLSGEDRIPCPPKTLALAPSP
jgi:hypothetical protein